MMDPYKRITKHEIITSNDYVDIFARIRLGVESILEETGAELFQKVSDEIGLFHIKVGPEKCMDYYKSINYMAIPAVYGLSSVNSMEAAGIGPILKSKEIDLTGNGILIGLLDTGIDYMHEAFIYEDNTSKIVSIWDQTEEGTPPKDFFYGTEYSNQQINEALQLEDPLSLVPTVDNVGHGTFIAGLAAGRENLKERFQGAAPNANLVVVKLKEAKQCLKKFYQVKEGALCYQTSDVLFALNYILQKAKELNQPVVILVAIATSEGPHNGEAYLEGILARMGIQNGVVVVTAGGNEATAAHHYYGLFDEKQKNREVQFNVDNKEKGLFFSTWVSLPDLMSIELLSPSGTTTGRVPIKINQWQNFNFRLEGSVVSVYYDILEERAGKEFIGVMLQKPLAGTWTIVVHGDFLLNKEFDIWLPISDFMEEDTIFLNPDPYNTVVTPSTNTGTLTIGAYNEILRSIYLPSGRGYTTNLKVKPDLVAPGVNVIGPYPRNQYGVMSGTSVASAIAAGASALLLEWGIVKNNDPTMNTSAIRNYLASGARRSNDIDYPNREWGYGELDLVNTFKIFR